MNIIKARYYWYIFSIILVSASVVYIALGGLKLSIDFTGGSIMELKFNGNRPEISQVSSAIIPTVVESASIVPVGEDQFSIKTEALSEEKHQQILTSVNGLISNNEKVNELRFDSIGPVIGSELKVKSLWSIFFVLILIISYIAFAFRKVSHPVQSWKYGLAAVMALAHDVIIITGLFAFLGYHYNVQIDVLFITAMLTLLGFSVHDTIVTFDRIRENINRLQDKSFEDIVNISVEQTIVRSINTTLTTFLAVLSVYLFGSETTKHFTLALLAGLIVGTYSSIFIASPLLYSWSVKKLKK